MLCATTLLRGTRLLKSIRTKKVLRFLSSSSNDETATSDPTSDTVVLYQRKDNRALFSRAVLFLGTTNMVYWVWYTFDFIPAMNQTRLEMLHIDPVFGWLGMSVSAITYAMTIGYPRYLLSKLEYNEKTQDLIAYPHDIPTISQSTKGYTHPLGSVTLDIGSSSAKKWMKEQYLFRGTVALSIKGTRMPYLMDIQEDDSVIHEKLLPIVLTPEQVVHVPNRGGANKDTRRVPVNKMRARIRRS